jgi:hypothetical protein
MSDFKRDFQANPVARLIQGRGAFAAAAARAEGRIEQQKTLTRHRVRKKQPFSTKDSCTPHAAWLSPQLNPNRCSGVSPA